MSDPESSSAEYADEGRQSALCGYCNRTHALPWFCDYDLHGEADSFKTSCASCEEEIESGADRAGDKYGNLYCDDSCKALGLSILMERMEMKA